MASSLIRRRVFTSRIEEQEAIMEQRIEVIHDLADLERDRDKQVNKLRRKSHHNIFKINISGLEGDYAHIKDIHSS